MATMNEHHKTLKNGAGKCSVPMWMGGMPAGFCDKPAYGERPAGDTFYNVHMKQEMRIDGKYSSYVPGLACPMHGGPERKEFVHKGDPCEFCNTPHDEVGAGLCPGLIEST